MAVMDAPDYMAPWDAVPYFQPVKRTAFTLSGTTAIQVCKPDPMRVAVVIGCNTNILQFDTVDNTVPLGGQPTGFSVAAQGVGYAVLRFAEVGPMVQGPLWANSTTGAVVITIWEILLAKWPRLQRRRR